MAVVALVVEITAATDKSDLTVGIFVDHVILKMHNWFTQQHIISELFEYFCEKAQMIQYMP
jgi:hypothetical protein